MPRNSSYARPMTAGSFFIYKSNPFALHGPRNPGIPPANPNIRQRFCSSVRLYGSLGKFSYLPQNSTPKRVEGSLHLPLLAAGGPTATYQGSTVRRMLVPFNFMGHGVRDMDPDPRAEDRSRLDMLCLVFFPIQFLNIMYKATGPVSLIRLSRRD